MTIQAMTQFADALRDDQGMACGLAAAIGQKQGGDAAAAFAAYAQEQGFAVTLEDAEALQAAAARDSEGALSGEQPDGASGGLDNRLTRMMHRL